MQPFWGVLVAELLPQGMEEGLFEMKSLVPPIVDVVDAGTKVVDLARLQMAMLELT